MIKLIGLLDLFLEFEALFVIVIKGKVLEHAMKRFKLLIVHFFYFLADKVLTISL